jgi:hypothetical protein
MVSAQNPRLIGNQLPEQACGLGPVAGLPDVDGEAVAGLQGNGVVVAQDSNVVGNQVSEEAGCWPASCARPTRPGGRPPTLSPTADGHKRLRIPGPPEDYGQRIHRLQSKIGRPQPVATPGKGEFDPHRRTQTAECFVVRQERPFGP